QRPVLARRARVLPADRDHAVQDRGRHRRRYDRAGPRTPLGSVDPALSEIVPRLLEQDPRRRLRSAAGLGDALAALGSGAVAGEPLAARASYLQLPVVVGRVLETAELTARLEAAMRGRARALLIGAPAGVGKSRLLQELELDARSADLPFALGQCRAEGLAP